MNMLVKVFFLPGVLHMTRLYPFVRSTKYSFFSGRELDESVGGSIGSERSGRKMHGGVCNTQVM